MSLAGDVFGPCRPSLPAHDGGSDLARRIITQIGLALSAAATIVITAQHMNPVYAGRAPGVKQLLAHTEWRDTAEARAPWSDRNQVATVAGLPWMTLPIEEATRTAQFAADRQAFKEDL